MKQQDLLTNCTRQTREAEESAKTAAWVAQRRQSAQGRRARQTRRSRLRGESAIEIRAAGFRKSASNHERKVAGGYPEGFAIATIATVNKPPASAAAGQQSKVKEKSRRGATDHSFPQPVSVVSRNRIRWSQRHFLKWFNGPERHDIHICIQACIDISHCEKMTLSRAPKPAVR